jgi:DNA (cytosine-5)-methyltransferase 1
MRALDLFRGAGGWSVACQRLGIEDYGVEIMPQANATAELAGHKTAWNDVWQPAPFEGEGLIASPPCQTFSAAGKGTGRKALDDVTRAIRTGHLVQSLDQLRTFGRHVGDDRTALVLAPLQYAHAYRPEWIALEQVPTVLPVWEAVAEELRAMGYSTWTGNLQAEQYGVPQTRKRAFLLASRTKIVAPPVPTHSRYYSRTPEKLDEGVQKWVSMAEALPHRGEWQQRSNYSAGNSQPGSTAEDRGRTIRTPDQPATTITSKGFAWEPLPGWAFRRPSTTIVGSFKPEVVAAPGYRTTVSRQNAPDSVRVTVQEAGILQSFPTDYPWQGAKGKQYLQVGNAVPPLLAEAVLKAVAL